MVDSVACEWFGGGMKAILFSLFVGLLIVGCEESSVPSDPLDPFDVLDELDLERDEPLMRALLEPDEWDLPVERLCPLLDVLLDRSDPERDLDREPLPDPFCDFPFPLPALRDRPPLRESRLRPLPVRPSLEVRVEVRVVLRSFFSLFGVR